MQSDSFVINKYFIILCRRNLCSNMIKMRGGVWLECIWFFISPHQKFIPPLDKQLHLCFNISIHYTCRLEEYGNEQVQKASRRGI